MLHINLADQYRRGSSRIHQLDPRVKLLGAILFILAATLMPPGSWFSFGLLLIAITFVSTLSSLGWAFALKRSFIVLPFVLAAVTLPFTVPGRTIAEIGNFTVSAEGSIRFVTILVKSWISVQAAILLTATTEFPKLLWGLRELRVPAPLVSIVGFMYRYLFVFADEVLRLMRARAARSAVGSGKAGGGIRWRGRVAGGMVGNLALRAFERSERVYDAMVSRGYSGEMKTLTPPTMAESDLNLLVFWVTYMAMTLLVGFFF